ncbi:MAG: hypothetical protein PHC28_11735 [Flavobacterium sp.]|uniref:hypothetical protein n=1 Tax=Flavobacterium sp. TaxID=239 RepID=UPI00260894D9|nr:hypothetical protein [Flavobacterium sp.]MDD5151124.1 hypothetical protein [Flavobacterium sp.]
MITAKNIITLQFSTIDILGYFQTHNQKISVHYKDHTKNPSNIIDSVKKVLLSSIGLNNKIIITDNHNISIQNNIHTILTNSLEIIVHKEQLLIVKSNGDIFQSIKEYLTDIFSSDIEIELSAILEHDISTSNINIVHYGVFLAKENHVLGGRSYIAIEHDDLFRPTCIDCMRGIDAFNRISMSLNNTFFVQPEQYSDTSDFHKIKICSMEKEIILQLNKTVYNVILLQSERYLDEIVDWFWNQSTFEFSLGHIKKIILSCGQTISITKQYSY